MLLAAMLLLAILLPRFADKPCAGFNAALPVPLLPMPALGRRCVQCSHRPSRVGMPSSCTLGSTINLICRVHPSMRRSRRACDAGEIPYAGPLSFIPPAI